MKRKFLLAASVAVVALAAVGAQAADLKPVTLAIGTKVLDTSQTNNTALPIYTHCWEEHGLDVTIEPTNSTAAMQALLAGEADFVSMGPGSALVARSKGAPITAVYLNMRKNFQFPVVLADSPIQSVADFKGKTMGVVSYGAQMVQIFKGMIAEAGLDPETDITIVETGVGAQAVAALESGQVDIWGTWDSQIATAENMGIELRRFTSPYAETLSFGSSIFVRDDYIDADPDAIVAMLTCMAQGSEMVMENPEGAVLAHWEIFPGTKPSAASDEEAMKQALHVLKTRAEFLELEEGMRWGEFPPGAAQVLVDFLKQNGVIEGELDPESVYTNQFVDALNDFDHEAVRKQAETLGQ